MRVIADDIREAALSAGRHIAVAVEIAAKSDSEYVTKQILTDTSGLEYVKITVGGDSDGVTIGKTYCAKLVIKIPRYIDIAEKDRLIVRVGYYTGAETSTGKIPLGWFYVDNITINGCVATVTAFDKMVRGSKNYISALDYPAVLSNVLDEVCSQMGLNLDSALTVPNYTINTPPIRGTDNDGNKLYYTKRQMLGFIGSLMGGNWFIEAGSHLSLTRFSDSVDNILAANVTESDINADIFTVTGISWNTGNQTYRRQDVDARGVIEFFNPLDVQREPILAALEMALVGKSYYGGKIKRQGAGWHEIGDVVNVPLDKSGTTRPILLTGIERVIQNGGYTEAWQSCAQTESEANYTIDSAQENTPDAPDTYNDAIILSQGDLPYIISSYSVVEYKRGYNIIAQGPGTSIVANGYVMRPYSVTPYDYNAPRYSSISYDGNVSELLIYESYVNSAGRGVNRIASYTNGTRGTEAASFGAFGYVLLFSTIYAPDSNYEFGSVGFSTKVVTENPDGTMVSNNNGPSGRMAFSSLAEYHAAIRLSKTPQMGAEVIETTIVDDGNSTLEKAMAYTDTVAKNLQDSFDNITKAEREQIAQNSDDIAAQSVRITATEGAIGEINSPTAGILKQANIYTDLVADELRGEFGS